MKINFEKAVSYIDTLYEKDEETKINYIDSTELKMFGTVVGSDVSRMMQLLIYMKRPQRILEIGTSIGYSTVSIANIAKEYGGKITTIEYSEQSARQAIKNFEHAGVAELIEVKIGDAKEIIPSLKESFDLIFQDVGDKTLYPILLNDLIALLKPGGVLLAEDSLLPVLDMNSSELKHFKSDQVEALDEFNQMVARCPYLKSTLLPIGDGLTIGIKIVQYSEADK
jgi:predicted O-methyltransferase YrrM